MTWRDQFLIIVTQRFTRTITVTFRYDQARSRSVTDTIWSRTRVKNKLFLTRLKEKQCCKFISNVTFRFGTFKAKKRFWIRDVMLRSVQAPNNFGLTRRNYVIFPHSYNPLLYDSTLVPIMYYRGIGSNPCSFVCFLDVLNSTTHPRRELPFILQINTK